MRLTRAENRALTESGKLNIVDPEAAFTLIRDRIEYDDSGTPKNVDELLRDLVKAKPYLVKQVGPPPSATANPASGGQNLAGTNKIPSWSTIFSRN